MQGGNTAACPDGGNDNHPSPAGGRKATGELVPLLNVFYNRWRAASAGATPTPPPPYTHPHLHAYAGAFRYAGGHCHADPHPGTDPYPGAAAPAPAA